MYETIMNPITKRQVNTKSKLGAKILQKYLTQLGGHTGFCAVKPATSRCVMSESSDGNCVLSAKNRCKRKTKKKGKKKPTSVPSKPKTPTPTPPTLAATKTKTVPKTKKNTHQEPNFTTEEMANFLADKERIQARIVQLEAAVIVDNPWGEDTEDLDDARDALEEIEHLIKNERVVDGVWVGPRPSKATVKGKRTTKFIDTAAHRILSKTSVGTKQSPIQGYSTLRLIEIFDILISHRKSIGNYFSVRNYMKAKNIIAKYTYEHIGDLSTMRDFFIANGMAKPTKMLAIIDEYIHTGQNAEATKVENMPEVVYIRNLTKIHGIGPKKAKKLWTTYGVSSISEFQQFVETGIGGVGKSPPIDSSAELVQIQKSWRVQRIFLKHLVGLSQRIPRAEIDAYNAYFKTLETLPILTGAIISINGSYRRKLETSGDIDLLITSNNPAIDSSHLKKQLIIKLKADGVIVDTLSNGSKKFMGIVKLASHGFTVARHLDIMHTPPDIFPFAQLYFTGSGGFNTRMRIRALGKGLSLNEYGLTHVDTKKTISSAEIHAKIGKTSITTEKDIFDFLDITYVEPEARLGITYSKI